MKKNQLSFIEKHIRGAIGKRVVYKHYKGGKVVKTKFPDMSNIIPSLKQKTCRNRFAEATRYANEIMHNEVQRTEWEKRTRLYKNDLRCELISRYMKAVKEKEWKARIASGKCVSYSQVQALPFQSQPLQQTLRSSRTKRTKRSPKRKPLSRPGMQDTLRPTRKTKRRSWIRRSKEGITICIPAINIPAVTKSMYQFLLGIISLIPIFGGRT